MLARSREALGTHLPAVLPLGLRQVHRVVRRPYQGLGISRVVRVEADPDADGGLHRVALQRDRLRHAREDLVGHGSRVQTATQRLEDDHELVSPDPRDGVAAPNGALERLRDRLEDEVAELMAVLVVGRLEVVDVEEEHREDRPGPRGVCEGLRHPVHQQIAVGQIGELVVRGEVLQIHLGTLEVVDLARDPHEADDVARAVADRHLGRRGPIQRRPLEPSALDDADDGLARLHDLEVFHERPTTERLAEQIDVGLAHELGRVGEAEVDGHPLADAEQAAVTILEIDAVFRVLHERTEARLLGEEIELSHHRTAFIDHVLHTRYRLTGGQS